MTPTTFKQRIDLFEAMCFISLQKLKPGSYYRRWIENRDALPAPRFLKLEKRMLQSPYVQEELNKRCPQL